MAYVPTSGRFLCFNVGKYVVLTQICHMINDPKMGPNSMTPFSFEGKWLTCFNSTCHVMFPSNPPMTYIPGIEMCGNLPASMANASTQST